MSVTERLRQLAAALPSDSSAVTITRADILRLIDADTGVMDAITQDMTIVEVAAETGRAPSTVRGWLIAGALRGYKLNGRDWRVPVAALRGYLEEQAGGNNTTTAKTGEVDITAWRNIRGS